MAKCQANKPAKIEFVPKTDIPIPHDLPVVIKGNRPTKEEVIQLAQFVCEIYSANVYPMSSCLQFAHIGSEATWQRWVNEFKEVKALYQEAKRKKNESYRAQVEELALDSLKKQITGYSVPVEEMTETVEIILPRDEAGNIIPDGEPIMELVTSRTIKKKTVYVRPSPTVTIFALTREFPTEESGLNEETNIPPIDWVD